MSSLLERYVKRKEKIKARSERSLVSVFAEIKSNSESLHPNSRQVSHHSLKISQRDLNMHNIENKK